jgi:hypothetical protein
LARYKNCYSPPTGDTRASAQHPRSPTIVEEYSIHLGKLGGLAKG